MQQVDDSGIHTNTRSISRVVHLAVHQVTKVGENDPLHGLHQVRGQSHWPEVVGLPGVCSLRYRNHTQCFPQELDSFQTEAQVEDVQEYSTELVCTVLQQSGVNAVRASSLPRLGPPQLPPHLISGDVEAGGVGGTME